MIQILRQDCRRLWVGIVLLTVAQALSTGLWVHNGPLFYAARESRAGWIASLLALSGMVLLTIMSVHRGSIFKAAPEPGMPPRQFLWAKLLFTLLVAQGPLFLCDAIEGLALGFPVSAAAGAATLRWLNMALCISLPVLVLALVLPSLLATLLAVVACVAVLVTGDVLFGALDLNMHAFAWITAAVRSAVFVAGALLALAAQYGARRIWIARGVVLVTLLLMSMPWLPWQARSDIQRWVSSSAAAQSLPTLERPTGDPLELRQLAGSEQSSLSLELPLQVSSLPRDAVLLFDSIRVRLVDASGSTVYENRDSTRNMVTEDRLQAEAAGTTASQTVGISVPPDPQRYANGQQLRVEMSYALTLALPTAFTQVSAVRDLQRVGWCKSAAFDDAGGAVVELGCLNTAQPPVCVQATQDEESVRCTPDYAPVAWQRLPLPDIVNRMQLSNRVVAPRDLTLYYAATHFTRTIVLPQVTVRYLPAVP